MGASGHKVMLLTLTIDTTDPRYADPKNRAGKSRPRASVLLDDPRAETIEQSTRYASWAWNRLRTYLTREYGAVPYFRGLEVTKRGVAHLHVLIRVRDSVEFMRLRGIIRGPEDDRASGLAVRAGFGLVVDAQMARRGGDVARYVTKMDGARPARPSGTGQAGPDRMASDGSDAAAYATKGTPAALPKYTRRSAWSLPIGQAPWAPGWVTPTPIAGFTWRVAHASVQTVTDALVRGDFVVVDPDRLRVPAERAGERWAT